VGRVRTALGPGGIAAFDRDRKVAVLAARERVVEAFDARTLRRVGRAPAGTGPTHLVSDGADYLYAIDTKGEALLVFRTRPELQLTRRYPLAGSPYGVAYDPVRRRIWVTLTATNRLVELAAGARPHRLRTFPTVRQPSSVAVDPATGRVFVTGRADGVLQLLDPLRR
jgi:DNA-binding beta-propeller fold protein YncE